MRKVDSFKILSSCQLLCCICKRPLSSELMLTSKPKLLSTFPTHSIELAGGLLWVWRTLCIENSLRRKNATWCIGELLASIPKSQADPPKKWFFMVHIQYSAPNGWESSAMLLLCFSWRHLCDVRWKEFVESGLYPVLLHQWNLKVVVIHTVIKLPFDLSEFYRMDQNFQQLVMRLFGWFSNTLPIGIFYKKETIWKYYFSLYQSETFQKLLVTSKVYLIGNLLRSPSS